MQSCFQLVILKELIKKMLQGFIIIKSCRHLDSYRKRIDLPQIYNLDVQDLTDIKSGKNIFYNSIKLLNQSSLLTFKKYMELF